MLTDAIRIIDAYRPGAFIVILITAVVSSIFLLQSKEAIRLSGKWAVYAAWSFLAICLQYSLYLLPFLITDFANPTGTLMLLGVMSSICAGVSNLFLWAAASILLNRRTFLMTSHFNRLIFIVIVILVPILPAAHHSLLREDSYMLVGTLFRLPDALISAFCLGAFFYAVGHNFISRQRTFWAIAGLLLALFCISTQLIYALNPLIATWKQLTSLITLNDAGYSLRPNESLYMLDRIVVAVAIPLRFLLFLPTAYLFFSFVIAANDFRKVLREVTERRQDYLSSDGLVRLIGESILADFVEVIIKLPGVEKQRFLSISWSHGQAVSEREPRNILLIDDLDPLLRSVLETSQDNFLQKGKYPEWHVDSSSNARPSIALAMLPLKFHGGVVGCLKVRPGKNRNFNYAALQQLSSMGDLLAPIINDFRALVALDEISYRFARLQLREHITNFHEAAQCMAEILHDVLAPLATGILLDVGFQTERAYYGANQFYHLTESTSARYEFEDLSTKVMVTNLGDVRVFRSLLAVTPRNQEYETFPLGQLSLVIPNVRDEVNHPTLGSYAVHRRAIASQTADAFLTLVRDYFNLVLKNFSVRLNAEALDQELWFKEVRQVAREVGLSWTVTTQTGSNKIGGDEEGIRVIQNLSQEDREALDKEPLSCVVHADLVSETFHVLRLDLMFSKHQLWFGIARQGFGLELNFPSPWKVFFENFAEIADSSLGNLLAVQRAREALIRLAESRAVMSIAITTGHLMHQLANTVDEQLFPAESLSQAIKRGDLQVNSIQQTQIDALLHGARTMKNLVAVFKNVTKVHAQRPCVLRDAVEQAIKFYEQASIPTAIMLENKVDNEMKIDVPFEVALFAIANLIGNAREAISKEAQKRNERLTGIIRIEAKDTNKYITCSISDNGPGISPTVLDKMFDLGVSSKEGHNGWGLYFTKNALLEHGGMIMLTESKPGFTQFTISFPKAR